MHNRKFILGHLGVWAFMSLFFMAVLLTQLPLWEVLALVIGNFGLLAVLFYAHARLVNRYWEHNRWLPFLSSGVLIFSAVCTARYLINSSILIKYMLREGNILVFSPDERLAIFVLVTSFIFTVMGIAYQLIINRYNREKQHLALLAEQRAAEIQFLKGQINPHFLFNALHNVYSLTVVKSDLAPDMLLKLSDLLRYVIYESRHAEIPLDREIAEIRNFIELFAMRSQPQPDIQLFVSGDLSQWQIEPMLLIPLVENCFKHTDFDTNPAAFCHIRLDATRPGVLLFSTRNSFNPADRQKDRLGGVGLDNMQRRMHLRYPDRHQFSYAPEGNVFEVTLRVSQTKLSIIKN